MTMALAGSFAVVRLCWSGGANRCVDWAQAGDRDPGWGGGMAPDSATLHPGYAYSKARLSRWISSGSSM